MTLVREPSIFATALRGLLVGAATVLLGGLAWAMLLIARPAPRHPTAAASTATLHGVVEMDPARPAGSIPEGACVYLALRRVDEPGGMPLATRRLAAVFPVPFEIGLEDSMTGQPMPSEVSLDARLDADGDPLTRHADEPVAHLDAVRSSTRSELRLVLR